MGKHACRFNGAVDAGEDRFDPRFDCLASATWHVLLVDVGVIMNQHTLSCDAHLAHACRPSALIHPAHDACYDSHAAWNIGSNRCEPRTHPADEES